MNVSSSFPDCPVTLRPEQLAQYWRDGYLGFENALSPAEVCAARESITQVIQALVFQDERSIYRPSKGDKGNQSGAAFQCRHSRLVLSFEPGFQPSPDHPDSWEPMVRKLMWFENETAVFKSIYTDHPRIQGVIKSILGDQVKLYQSMALIKPAFHGSEKPWHQDNAYFSVEDLDGVLGTWIALDDVSVENGAMHFLPGGHRAGPLKHEHTTDCEIVKDRYSSEGATPINLRAGGIVFFHGNAPHFTPPNHSPLRRRALQYHYRAATNAEISKAAYDQVFVEADGNPASCAAAVQENF